MAILDVKEVLHVSNYPLMDYIVLNTIISDGVTKMRSATLLVYIFCLHQCTKNLMKYVQVNSIYGNFLAMPDSDTQELFSRAARDKGWVGKILIHLPGENKGGNVSRAQYLSKYLFNKYEDEAIFDVSQCGLPVITSINLDSVSDMVDDSNITLTRLIIILNYIIDSFGKCDILL